jgi:hypothetical protein
MELQSDVVSSSVTRIDRQLIGCNIPQTVLHSLMFLKMGKIDVRNMSS